MKRIARIVILLFIVYIAITERFPQYAIGYEVATGVTGDKIKQIELGMTREQVIDILGKPLKVGTTLNCDKTIELLYAKYDSWVIGGTNFWILIDSNNCVESIYAKDCDNLVYWKNPNNDFINEERFKKYFK